MASSNAVLAGFPPVIRAKVYQGTGVEPGVAVIDTTVAAGASANYPATTTLTMTCGGNTLTWPDMRVKRVARVRKGYMRTVLEDSRYKLRDTVLGANYNERDASGILRTASKKTISELCGILAAASGLTVTAGTVNEFYPPAQWRGKNCAEALLELLHDGVLRIVYNPTTSGYQVWAMGSGTAPVLDNAMYRPAPKYGLAQVDVRSMPKLYEQRVSVDAVYDDGSGVQKLLSSHTPKDYFNGFANEEDKVLQTRLRQSAFRCWSVSAAASKESSHHRAVAGSVGPANRGYVSARFIRNDLYDQMSEQRIIPLGGTSSDRFVDEGGGLFWCDDPFIQVQGGNLKTTAELLVGFYNLDGGKRQINVQTRAVATGQGTRVIQADWICPINSGEADVPANQWDTVHSQVADAWQTAFQQEPQTIKVPGLPLFPISGHIGAAVYRLSAYPRPDARTIVAVGYSPRATGSF